MLQVDQIQVYYDGLQALAAVSLRVQPGEIVCILGPNGAGKSTLMKAIAGLLTPASGRILLEGRPIHGLRPHQVNELGIALVPEEGWLYPQMDVEENLLMGAYPKQTRALVAERLRFVYDLFPALAERRKGQLAETLSGGERQMLAVGRGLMAKPKILMLDEPSLGLAPLVIKDIFAALVKINRDEGTSILLTEQNVFHAIKISQRGYLLENGCITMEDEAGNLLNSEHIKKNYLGL